LALLLVPAVLLTGVSAVYFARNLFKPGTGLVVNFPEVTARQGALLFAPKTPFSPAVAAGLLPERDRILSVAGRPVRTIREVIDAEGRIRDFRPVPVEVLRDDGRRLTLEITPVLPLTRPDWVFALLFCATLGFMAFYLILRLPEDTASNLVALGALFYLVFTAVKPFYYESLASNLLIHLGKLTSWFMVFFALYFPSPKASRTVRLSLVFGVLLSYAGFIAVRLVLFRRWQQGMGDHWYLRYREWGRWQNLADAAAFLVYAGLLVWSYLRSPGQEERRRIEWILAGFLIGIPPYFFLDQLPLILGEPPGLRISLGGFANLFLAFVPLLFLVGLLRHRLFNLRFFLLRYLLYFLLVLFIFAFFLLFYAPVEEFFRRAYSLPPRLAGFLVTALLFLALLPLRAMLCAALERLFFPGHYAEGARYSASLETRNRELRLLLDELNRRQRRSFQMDKLVELRQLLEGIAARIGGPVDAAAAELQERPATGGDPPAARSGLLELRDFARKLTSLAGRSGRGVQRVSAEAVCRVAGAELRRRFPAAEVRLEGGAAAGIRCHPEELAQVLRCLLENAAEAGPGRPIRLRIAAADGAVSVCVEDEGPGFSPGELRRAFRPFRSTKPGHDGLGLYFCKTLVERNGGSIRILPPLDSGARVRVSFLGETI
jgi:signal transduction histidine kinase